MAEARGAFSLPLLLLLEPVGLMSSVAGCHLQWLPFLGHTAMASGGHFSCREPGSRGWIANLVPVCPHSVATGDN